MYALKVGLSMIVMVFWFNASLNFTKLITILSIISCQGTYANHHDW